ncbi:hypothetical protein WG954_05670 [Lacibacter sp. H375]|uniref:hypothetical protein n=1 Tax=Lacibacter sp. H375 TaxID=3133424 RepID=UPI0030C638FC
MTATRQLQIVLVFAFIIRLLLLYCFPLHMTDHMLINSAAQNLIEGHGMGFIRSSPEDLSSFYFEGLRLWPPLVTATTALFLDLTGHHPSTDLLMMTLVLIGFIWVLYLLCKEIGMQTNYIVYIFLVFALNPELIKRPGFSDLTAAFFCIGAILFLVKQLKKNNLSRNLTLLLGSFLFFLPSAFRYQYYPVTLFFPLVLLLSSIYLKDKTLLKRSAISLLLVLLFIILQEYFLFVYTSQPINQAVAMDKTGLFLFNLQNSYPFFFKTFFNISYVENTWKHIILPFRYFYFAVAAFLLIFLLFLITRFLVFNITRQREIRNNEVAIRQTLSVLSLVPFLLLPISVLIGLSLTHNSRTGQPGGWTYVNEGRYFILPSILLLLLTFWFIQNKWAGLSGILKKTLFTLFVITIVYNLALTLKFCYNAITNNIPDKELSNRLDRAAAYNYVRATSNDEPPTVITYTEPYFTFFPYIKNVAITKKIELLRETRLSTKKKVRLLIICQKDATEAEFRFIQDHKAVPVLHRPNFTIYSTTIDSE